MYVYIVIYQMFMHIIYTHIGKDRDVHIYIYIFLCHPFSFL